MTEENRKQKENSVLESYAKKQYYMSMITAFSSVLVLCVVLFIACTTVPKVHTLLQDLQVSTANIQKISTELAEADLPGMIEDVNGLVSTSDASVQTAMDKLNSIDFDALNSAITDLANIVRPLGKLFGGR